MANRRSNGEGSIHRRTKTRKDKNGIEKSYVYWEGQICLDHDVNGKLIRKTVTGKTQKEVREKLRLLENEFARQSSLNSANPTVTEYTKRYLEHKETNLAITTLRKYEQLAERHIYKHALGNMKIKNVQRTDIQDYVREKSTQQNLANASIQDILKIISPIFNEAVENRLIKETPCRKIDLPKKEKKPATVLSKEELERLLATLSTHPYYPYILLCCTTGIRREELLGLRWDHVDFTKNTIKIEKTVVLAGSELVLKNEGKTKGSHRTLPFPSSLSEMLLNEKETATCEFLLSNSKGTGPVRPDVFSNTYRKLCKKAQIPHAGLHCLRHTFASILVSEGIALPLVQKALGHSDISMTLRYTHAMADQAQEVSNTMNTYFQNLVPPSASFVKERLSSTNFINCRKTAGKVIS